MNRNVNHQEALRRPLRPAASAGAVPAPAAPAGSAPVWRRAVGRWAAAALLAVALPACIDDADLCGPDDGGATAPAPLLLSLQISAPAPGATRASAPGAASSAATRAEGHDLDLDPATAAENYLAFDQGDYQVLIFDGFGRFLQTFNPQWTLSSWQNDGTTYNTTLIGPLALEFPEIQIMVLANCATFDAEWGTHFSGATAPNNFVLPNGYPNWQYGTFLSDFYANSVSIYQKEFKDSFTYTPSSINNGNTPSPTGAYTWRPNFAGEKNSANRGIPMFGLSDVISLEKDVDRDYTPVEGEIEEGARVVHGDIKMLRALAKIEVINGTPADEPATIARVALSHYSTGGRVIPNVADNPLWDKPQTQVSRPSLTSPDAVPQIAELRFYQPDPNSDRRVAYVPEMAIGQEQFDLNDAARPHINVYIDNTNTAPYRVELADYDPTTKKPDPTKGYAALLRNHIYRYTITSVGVSAEFELEVLPWDLVEDDAWEFTENIVIPDDGWIKWANYANATTATVTVPRPAGANASAVAEATFTIQAPVGGTWHAMFRPLVKDGNTTPNDAFVFVDENGAQVSEVTGPTGTPAVIRVKGAYLNDTGSYNYEALLVIMVETPDGRWMEADVVDGPLTNYTIVQSYM